MRQFQQLFLELGNREKTPRTGGIFRQISMEIHLIGGYLHLALEPLDQIDKLGYLGISKGASVSISDQADTDGPLVVKIAGRAGDMSTRELLIPSVAHVDNAIAEAIAIADQEVVAETFQAEAEVQLVDGLEIAGRFTGMMDDNAGPAFSFEGSADLEDRVEGWLSAEGADIRRNQKTTPGIRAFLHGQQTRYHCHGHKKG